MICCVFCDILDRLVDDSIHRVTKSRSHADVNRTIKHYDVIVAVFCASVIHLSKLEFRTYVVASLDSDNSVFYKCNDCNDIS